MPVITVRNPDKQIAIGETQESRNAALVDALKVATSGATLLMPHGAYTYQLPQTDVVVNDARLLFNESVITNATDKQDYIIKLQGDRNTLNGLHCKSITSDGSGDCLRVVGDHNVIRDFVCSGTSELTNNGRAILDASTSVGNRFENLRIDSVATAIRLDGFDSAVRGAVITRVTGVKLANLPNGGAAIQSNSNNAGTSIELSDISIECQDDKVGNYVAGINLSIMERVPGEFDSIILRNIRINRAKPTNTMATSILKLQHARYCLLDNVRIATGPSKNLIKFMVARDGKSTNPYSIDNLIVKNSQIKVPIRTSGSPIGHLSIENSILDIGEFGESRYFVNSNIGKLTLRDVCASGGVNKGLYFQCQQLGAVDIDGLTYGGHKDSIMFATQANMDVSKWKIDRLVNPSNSKLLSSAVLSSQVIQATQSSSRDKP